ncbi:MAG: glycosyltransferase, partial [Nocardioides sp.]|nr:glycosyltransferase [Nocardioides sp.]
MTSRPSSPGASAPRVLVIMPAWNEQGSVAQTVREVLATNPGVDVLVVDDGSADHTADVAARAGAAVCRLPFNLGVGGAMRAGYRHALRDGYYVAVLIYADCEQVRTYLP